MPDDRFAAHRRAKFFGVLAIGPWRGQAAARLAIRDERRRHFANAFHVERTGRAAAGVRNDARVWIDLAHLAVPQLPEIKQPLLAPENVGAPRRVLRIVRAWQIEAARVFEILPAVLAVAHARAVPAIDEDAIDPVARHDLVLHFGHELEVVRAKPAGDPHLRRSPVAALGCRSASTAIQSGCAACTSS